MNRARRLFRLIAPTIFFIFYIYICHQLFRFSGLGWNIVIPLMAWILLIFAGVLILPMYFWFKPTRGESERDITFQKVAYFCQGYFSYLLFLVVLRDIMAFGLSITDTGGLNYGENEAYALLLLPVVLMLLGRIPIELGPFVKKTRIQFQDLHQDLQGVRIVQMSDLHIGPGMTLSSVKKIVEKANALNADVIVLTGDIVDHVNKWFEDEIDELGKLKAKYGVYFIPGNHEYYWGFQPIIDKMRAIGLRVLLNENEKIKVGNATLAICGITDHAAEYFQLEKPDLEKSKLGAHDSDFHLLLAHQPFIADTAKNMGFDLQLSGHTHAGQFIPWSLMIRLFQKYPKGLYDLGPMKLYVNQGTGFWGPKDRLGTFPEISLIVLK